MLVIKLYRMTWLGLTVLSATLQSGTKKNDTRTKDKGLLSSKVVAGKSAEWK
jgi:hypothetical protein